MSESRMSPGSGSPDLHGLASEFRELLGRYLHGRSFPKGALLWSEGESTGMLVALKSGRVKVYRLLPTGRAVTIYLFGPDDVFGFLPFLDGRPYPAYAQAIEDVEADVMPRSALLEALRAEPDLALTLIGLLGQRLRSAFELIERISTPGVRARVASALVPLLPESAGAGDSPLIELPVTAHDFAGAIGIVPETLSRALSSLVEAGIIERAGTGRYRVLDLRALEEAAETPPS